MLEENTINPAVLIDDFIAAFKASFSPLPQDAAASTSIQKLLKKFQEGQFSEAVVSAEELAERNDQSEINLINLVIALANYEQNKQVFSVSAAATLIAELRKISQRQASNLLQNFDIYERTQKLLYSLTVDYAAERVRKVINNEPGIAEEVKNLVIVDKERGISFQDVDDYTAYQILKRLYETRAINAKTYAESLKNLYSDNAWNPTVLDGKLNRQQIKHAPQYVGTFKKGLFYGAYAARRCLKTAGNFAKMAFVGVGHINAVYWRSDFLFELALFLTLINVATVVLIIATGGIGALIAKLTLESATVMIATNAASPLGLSIISFARCLVASAASLIASVLCYLASPVMGLMNALWGCFSSTPEEKEAEASDNENGAEMALLERPDQPVVKAEVEAQHVAKTRVFKYQHVRDSAKSLSLFYRPAVVPAISDATRANSSPTDGGPRLD